MGNWTKNIKFVTLIMAMSLLHSCVNNREILIKEFPLENFSILFSECNATITLHQDDKNFVELIWYEDFIDDIDIISKDDSLIFIDNSKNKYLHNYSEPEIHVYFKNLTRIHLKHSAEITSKDTIRSEFLSIAAYNRMCKMNLIVNADHLRFINMVNSSGDYIIAGKANYAHFRNNAGGYLNAINLEVEDLLLRQESLLDAEVNVKNSIQYSITSAGNIYCKGNPQTVKIDSITGSGKFYLID